MSKKQKKAHKKDSVKGTRYTVDDPVNDVHDDELYDEETGLQKNPDDNEPYERPW